MRHTFILKGDEKAKIYQETINRISALIYGEADKIAIMASVVCELKQSFSYFDWVGFYRNMDDKTLKIGPYQGSHGCLTIDFYRGVCGKAATTKRTQLTEDVNSLPHHIACSSTTLSEIVVPWTEGERLIAVLDVDSDTLAAFDEIDQYYLETLCQSLNNI